MIVRAEGALYFVKKSKMIEKWSSPKVQMAGNTENDYLWKYLDYSYFRRDVEYKAESVRSENDLVARDNYQPNC